MVKSLLFCVLMAVGCLSLCGCGGSGDNAVVVPPSDEAARLEQQAAEAAYDKELADQNK